MRRSDDTFGVVAGTLVGIVAVGLFVAGLAVLAVGTFGTEDGYLHGPVVSMSSDGHAVRTDRLALGADPGAWFPDGGAVRTRITVTPDAPDTPVFAGIGRSADIDQWLSGASLTVVSAVGDDGRIEVEVVEGAATPTAPADQDFWAATATGSETTDLVWDDRDGSWELVVANADGSAEVVATAQGAVRLRLVGRVGLSMMAGGLVAGLASLFLLARARRQGRRGPSDDPGQRPSRHPASDRGSADQAW